MSIEGNMLKCDACGRERRMPGSVNTSAVKIEAVAKRLGWKSAGERDHCPDCV
jgi:hypothetical protein